MRAVLKRVYRIKDKGEEKKVIVLGRCSVNLSSGVACIEGKEGKKEATLTAKEYAIIEKLAVNRGQIVTIDALCEHVWQDGNYGYENTLMVHIRRLREKIEEEPSHPRYLITVRGLGYKLL